MDRRKNQTTANEKMWDARAKNYDKYFWFTHWDEKKLVSILKLTDKFALLDLACGPGWALRYIDQQTNGAGELYGVDISSNMIKTAQKKSAVQKNIHFSKALRRAYPTTRNVGLLPRWEYEDVSLPTWEKPLDDAHYFAGLQSVIRDLAKSSSIVIRGRGSQFILKDYPGTLRILIVAPLELRVQRVAESSKSD